MRRYITCFKLQEIAHLRFYRFAAFGYGKDSIGKQLPMGITRFLFSAFDVQQVFVARNIFCGGSIPREVHLHDFFDKLRPFFGILVKQFCFADDVEHIMSIVCGKRKSVTAAIEAVGKATFVVCLKDRNAPSMHARQARISAKTAYFFFVFCIIFSYRKAQKRCK